MLDISHQAKLIKCARSASNTEFCFSFCGKQSSFPLKKKKKKKKWQLYGFFQLYRDKKQWQLQSMAKSKGEND